MEHILVPTILLLHFLPSWLTFERMDFELFKSTENTLLDYLFLSRGRRGVTDKSYNLSTQHQGLMVCNPAVPLFRSGNGYDISHWRPENKQLQDTAL